MLPEFWGFFMLFLPRALWWLGIVRGKGAIPVWFLFSKKKFFEIYLLTHSLDNGTEYDTLIHLIKSEWNPSFSSVCSKCSQSTLSNAFSASRLRSIEDSCPCFLAEIIFRVLLSLFIPWRPGINPVCSGLIVLLMHLRIHSASIVVQILTSQQS